MWDSLAPPHRALLRDDVLWLAQLLEGETSLSQLVDPRGFTLEELAGQLGSYRCWRLLVSQRSGAFPHFTILRPSHRQRERMDSDRLLQLMGVCYSSQLRFSSWEAREQLFGAIPSFDELKVGGLVEGAPPQEELYTNNTIIWLGEPLGFGLMNNRPIPQGGYIGEYTGLLRSTMSYVPLEGRYSAHYPTQPGHRDYAIDARFWGNEMRYVNHSWQPNLVPIWHYDRGLLRLYYVAERSIARGEQLTINYGSGFWGR